MSDEQEMPEQIAKALMAKWGMMALTGHPATLEEIEADIVYTLRSVMSERK